MKFKEALGFDFDESAVFLFSKHNDSDACMGDQIWSDGEKVHIFQWAERDVIGELIDMVENKKTFTGALRRMGLV